MPESDSSPTNTSRLLLLFAGLTVGLAIVLLILPPTIQPILFWLIMLVGIVSLTIRLSGVAGDIIKRTADFLQNHQQQARKISGGIGVMLMFVSGWFYQPAYIAEFYGFDFFLMSLPFLWYGRSIFRFDPMPYQVDVSDASAKIRWWVLGLTVIPFVSLILINSRETHWKDTLWMTDVPTWIQMVLFVAVIAGLLIGFRAKFLPNFEWKRHHWLLLAIVLLGGAVRSWNLEYTLRLFVDELFFMNDVTRIRVATPSLFYPDFSPSTDVFSYFQALFVDLLGPSLTGLRMPSPLIVMFGLVVVYAFARQLVSVRAGLLSAFLFAVMPVHIQFGRIGMNMIVDPIFAMLAFVFLFRGMQSRYIGDFALVGVMFGLTQYFYEAGRLFVIPFFICWLVWMVIFGRRDPMFRLPSWRHWGVMIFCFAVLATPIYTTRHFYGGPITERLNATRAPDFLLTDRISEFLLANEFGYIGAPLHRYVHDIARDNFFYSDYAYVLPIIVPFFLIGLVLLIFQIHRMRGALSVWWIYGVYIANSTFIADGLSAASPRYIISYATLMVIAGIGIDRVWSALETHVVRYRRVIVVGFMVYLSYVGVYQIHHYFNETVPYYYDRLFSRRLSNGEYRPAMDDMVFRIVELPQNTSVHLIRDILFPKTHIIDIPNFFERDDLYVNAMMLSNLGDQYFQALPRDVDHVFVFSPYDQDQALDIINDYFVITRVEGSTFDIPEFSQMLFAYAPLSANPPPDPIQFEFERPPNAVSGS